MNKLDELVKPYLPTDEEMEMCKSYCDRMGCSNCSVEEIRNAFILDGFVGDAAIYNSLMRNGINSIEKLDAVSLDTLSKFKCIGIKRLIKLAELKEMIARC